MSPPDYSWGRMAEACSTSPSLVNTGMFLDSIQDTTCNI